MLIWVDIKLSHTCVTSWYLPQGQLVWKHDLTWLWVGALNFPQHWMTFDQNGTTCLKQKKEINPITKTQVPNPKYHVIELSLGLNPKII